MDYLVPNIPYNVRVGLKAEQYLEQLQRDEIKNNQNNDCDPRVLDILVESPPLSRSSSFAQFGTVSTLTQ